MPKDDPPDDGVTRDADGLVVDAYSDDSLSDGPRVDALDADVLVSDLALEQMDTASPRDEALELPDAVSDDAATTRNEDAHVGPRRSIERGIGAELNSIDDMASSAIGEQSAGRRAKER